MLEHSPLEVLLIEHLRLGHIFLHLNFGFLLSSLRLLGSKLLESSFLFFLVFSLFFFKLDLTLFFTLFLKTSRFALLTTTFHGEASFLTSLDLLFNFGFLACVGWSLH